MKEIDMMISNKGESNGKVVSAHTTWFNEISIENFGGRRSVYIELSLVFDLSCYMPRKLIN